MGIPAVDSGLSVSRVGSAAQTKAMKSVSGSLKLDLAQYHELLSFAQFGSELDAATKATIDHGARLTELLKQPQYSPLSQSEQVLSLFAAKHGYLKSLAVDRVKDFEEYMHKAFHEKYADVVKEIEEKNILSDELVTSIKEKMQIVLDDFIKVFGEE